MQKHTFEGPTQHQHDQWVCFEPESEFTLTPAIPQEHVKALAAQGVADQFRGGESMR